MSKGAKLTRVLLKLSGEALSGGPAGESIDPSTLKAISEELAEVHSSGCQIGIDRSRWIENPVGTVSITFQIFYRYYMDREVVVRIVGPERF